MLYLRVLTITLSTDRLLIICVLLASISYRHETTIVVLTLRPVSLFTGLTKGLETEQSPVRSVNVRFQYALNLAYPFHVHSCLENPLDIFNIFKPCNGSHRTDVYGSSPV